MWGITTAPMTATAVASSPLGSDGTKRPLATSAGRAPETAARAAKEAPFFFFFFFRERERGREGERERERQRERERERETGKKKKTKKEEKH